MFVRMVMYPVPVFAGSVKLPVKVAPACQQDRVAGLRRVDRRLEVAALVRRRSAVAGRGRVLGRRCGGAVGSVGRRRRRVDGRRDRLRHRRRRDVEAAGVEDERQRLRPGGERRRPVRRPARSASCRSSAR